MGRRGYGRGRDDDRPSGGYVDPEDVPDTILDLVTFMAKNLVKHPDDVDVSLVEGETRPIVELRVNKEDLGHVIGKHGRTSKAMRLLVNAAATKAKVRVDLDIIDDDEDEGYEG